MFYIFSTHLINLKSYFDFSVCGQFLLVGFFCVYKLPRVSQPGFIYIFAFKKGENLHFYKPTFDSSGWQGSEVNEEDCGCTGK